MVEERHMESSRLMNVSAQEAHPCIWMQAGVVSKKLCQTMYDCPSCRFDRILRRVSDENLSLKREGAVREGKIGLIVSWQRKLRAQPATKRPCIHHMKGRIEFKVCTNDYKCANCDFDQYFNDQYSVHAVMSPMDVLDVKGFKVPQGYYFLALPKTRSGKIMRRILTKIAAGDVESLGDTSTLAEPSVVDTLVEERQ